MKKLFFIFALVFMLSACSDEPVVVNSDGPPSRALVDYQDLQSSSNPTLISDWENVTQITLNRFGAGAVTAPWSYPLCIDCNQYCNPPYSNYLNKGEGIAVVTWGKY